MLQGIGCYMLQDTMLQGIGCYMLQGIGCYMFRIDDMEVVDATMKGSAARFINHSCDVSCDIFTKVLWHSVLLLV